MRPKTRRVALNTPDQSSKDISSEEVVLKPKEESEKTRKYIHDKEYEDGEQYNPIELENGEEMREDLTNKQKFDSFLKNDKFLKIISLLSVIFSLYIYFGYVVGTYFPLNDLKWFDISNASIATFFNIESILYLYLAQHKLIYFFSFQNILELFTSIYPYFYGIDNFYNKKILEIARICHLFRISKYFNNIKLNENPITKCLIDISVLIFISIFFFGSIFRIVEIEQLQNLIINPKNRVYALSSQVQFHEFYYFSMITLFTLGYGEIYPISELGRVVILCFIIYSIYLIQDVSRKLFNALRGTSEYSRQIYKSSEDIFFIVLCGTISVEALTSFCEELFHPDHGQSQKHIVILNNKEPSNEMMKFLHMSKYELDVKYIHGNPFNDKDLEKVAITKAKVIILLTDKYSFNYKDKMDDKNVLMALYIKKYLFIKNTENIPIYLQLIDPLNISNYNNFALKYKSKKAVSQDQFIINEEIKINLISKSCLMPGLIPFISNLIRSSGSSEKTNSDWLNEYLEGFEQEIYKAELNDYFKGKTFAQISKIIYKNFDAIAFAFEIEIDGKTFIFLNPGDFVINKYNRERHDVKYYLYVICSDKSVNNRIQRADLKNKDDSDEEDEFGGGTTIEKKVESKNIDFSDDLNLSLEDVLLLEDKSSLNYKVSNKEDDYFFLNSNSLVPLDFKKDSIRNNPKYENHIIICGYHSKIYKYILPLRAKYIGAENMKYIVVLAQNIPKNLWDSISKFEKIILINGSPLNRDDLLRANIEFASNAIILEDNKMKEIEHLNEFSQKLIDKNRILIYKTIKQCNPNIQIMIELAYESNIEYLLGSKELVNFKKNMNYNYTSVFSSGEVYFNSIIDSLTAQAYYNKHIVTIIHQLLIDGSDSEKNQILKISESFGLKSSNFFQAKIPNKFIGKAFGDLYEEFCDNNFIILALYRLPGSTDNYKGYVFTKPSEDTFLKEKDQVFVLGVKEKFETYYKEQKTIVNKSFSQVDEDEKKNEMEFNEEANEDINKYSPFSYCKEKATEIEKEINKIYKTMLDVRATIKETISNGIKQETSYILQ